jgi:hypothetical protein
VCAECAVEAPADARGWRAYVADDPRDDEPPDVATYCPECAEREFGHASPRGGGSLPFAGSCSIIPPKGQTYVQMQGGGNA